MILFIIIDLGLVQNGLLKYRGSFSLKTKTKLLLLLLPLLLFFLSVSLCLFLSLSLSFFFFTRPTPLIHQSPSVEIPRRLGTNNKISDGWRVNQSFLVLVPRAYDSQSGLRQESRALGATISGMRHRCRLLETGWAEFGYFLCYLKMVLSKTFHRAFKTIDRDRITSRLIYDNKIFCTRLFWCSLKHPFIKLTKLLFRCLNAPYKSFYVDHALHADWMMLKNASNQGESKQRDCCSFSSQNPGRKCWSLRKLYFSKIIWRLALKF